MQTEIIVNNYIKSIDNLNIGSVTSAVMQKMADLGVTSVQIKCDDAIGYLAVYR